MWESLRDSAAQGKESFCIAIIVTTTIMIIMTSIITTITIITDSNIAIIITSLLEGVARSSSRYGSVRVATRPASPVDV